jgi:hypothetical protein
MQLVTSQNRKKNNGADVKRSRIENMQNRSVTTKKFHHTTSAKVEEGVTLLPYTHSGIWKQEN